MSDESLLPYNATDLERGLALAVARVSNVPTVARKLWSADDCPADKLAWLAWAFGVDEWDDEWSEESKRQTIRDAFDVQRRKGTIWSIRRVLTNAGYGAAQIIEGAYQRLRDGSIARNGYALHGETSQWATYRVILERPITNGQAAQVRRLLQTTAPARCKLVEFNYTAVTNRHNGAITRDGTFNRGAA